MLVAAHGGQYAQGSARPLRARLGALTIPFGSTSAGATEYSWPDTDGVCGGSGSGSGGQLVVSVADYALLNSADYHRPVKWRVWLHEHNPEAGEMR